MILITTYRYVQLEHKSFRGARVYRALNTNGKMIAITRLLLLPYNPAVNASRWIQIQKQKQNPSLYMRQRNISRMINTNWVAAAAVVVFCIIKWRFAGALTKLSDDYLMIRLARCRQLIFRRDVNKVLFLYDYYSVNIDAVIYLRDRSFKMARQPLVHFNFVAKSPDRCRHILAWL